MAPSPLRRAFALRPLLPFAFVALSAPFVACGGDEETATPAGSTKAGAGGASGGAGGKAGAGGGTAGKAGSAPTAGTGGGAGTAGGSGGTNAGNGGSAGSSGAGAGGVSGSAGASAGSAGAAAGSAGAAGASAGNGGSAGANAGNAGASGASAGNGGSAGAAGASAGNAGASGAGAGSAGASAGNAGAAGAGNGGASAGAGGNAAGASGAGGSAGAGGTSGGVCGVVEAAHVTLPSPHVTECSYLPYAESNPPSSGPHYGIWAAFKTYTTAVPRGYLVHDLEHGAIVITYNCPTGCAAEVAKAQAVIDAFVDPLCANASSGSKKRVTMAPDPKLDTTWAVAAWGHTLRATCVDAPAFSAFMVQHFDKATESFCNEGLDVVAQGLKPKCGEADFLPTP